MSILVFESADLLRVVRFSMNNEQRYVRVDSEHGPAFVQPKIPHVVLSFEVGIRMTAYTFHPDYENGKDYPEFAAFARGCNPKMDKHWLFTSRTLVGARDFVLVLPWALEIQDKIKNGATEINVEFVTRDKANLL